MKLESAEARALAGDGRLGAAARLASTLSELDEDRRPEADRLLGALAAVLKRA